MIFVDGAPFPARSSSFSSPSPGRDTLLALMEHPTLVSVAHAFKSTRETKFSASAQKKWVYVFQREYATVDPARVDFVGTDEATTCVGLVIRNRKSGMTSIAHMDFPQSVENGLNEMLSLLDCKDESGLDVHLLGAFEDVSTEHAYGSQLSESSAQSDGYSVPICAKIVETLQNRQEKFHIHTLFVLAHNTRRDSQENSYPIFNGLLVETNSGSITPASFDKSSRCPDEIVRRIRVSASFKDPSLREKLLETYDTQTDRFMIAPCSWSGHYVRIASVLQELSDAEILHSCSTSPSAEGPDFVDNGRRQWDYLIKHPDWRETFPRRQPRVFGRTDDGGWKMCLPLQDIPQGYVHQKALCIG
ncbi:protein N-terminal asparagine amidohydrolase isoform X1 [Tripterygium wilfordii]|uniref:Protein N-terminal asparagine amidohydrolase isoform X1 n=2 Tax=Tripterygium wilfordii TaxID=458696 RepID=A0A7J7E2B5_TRIWF|nr:protein N-terminal asparagine amidohydrolase isoform X1 [Tripterygium wilfordii]